MPPKICLLALFSPGMIFSLATCQVSPFSGLRSMEELNELMERHLAREGSLTEEEWLARLPSQAEKDAVLAFLPYLLRERTLKNCDPRALSLYPPLDKIMTLSPFMDTFCVLHEPLPPSPSSLFPRLFGYVVVRASSKDVKDLHHSSPHFESDGAVHKQAAVLFEKTRSRSVVLSGSSRFSVRGRPSSSCQPGNTIADAAHDSSMMFHTFNSAIWEGVRNSVSSTFIQWHGMANTSCQLSTAFISLGAKGTSHIYDDDSNIANMLASIFNEAPSSSMKAMTPRTDSTCNLVASTNIFGRLLHGVPAKNVCARSANLVNERFIHIEQKQEAREALSLWAAVINLVFS